MSRVVGRDTISRPAILRPPCPGTPDGHPCPKRRRLIASSRDGRCSLCRLAAGPAAPVGRPADELLTVDLPADVVEAALERIRPLCRPEVRRVISGVLLDQLMLSCYRQGLLDREAIALDGAELVGHERRARLGDALEARA